MSIRPKTDHSNHSIKQAFTPNASLNNPLRVSTANQFDSLLNSEIGQKMFSRQQSRERTPKTDAKPKAVEESFQKNPSFLNKMHNSGSRTGLKTSSSNPNLKDARFEKAHTEITKVNNDIVEAKKRLEDEMQLLGGFMSPEKRKCVLEGLKKCQKRYKSLKDSRLLIVKRQRIMKNEHPASKEGLEVYNWQDLKKKESAEIKLEEQKRVRQRRISAIHFVDPSLTLKAEPSAQKIIRRGLKRLNATMPSHYHDTAVIFTAQEALPNPVRNKRLSDFSHGHRNFNIITGACF